MKPVVCQLRGFSTLKTPSYLEHIFYTNPR